jgi:hypothetical protein
MLIFCGNQLGHEWRVAMADRVSGTALQWIKRDERTAFRSREFAIALRRAHRRMGSLELWLVNFTNKHLVVSIQDTRIHPHSKLQTACRTRLTATALTTSHHFTRFDELRAKWTRNRRAR